MKETLQFIKDCGVFFVLTANDNQPFGRPFGAIMIDGNDLYITTADNKQVYSQLKNNGKIQIVAIKQGTRCWARVTGVATEIFDVETKDKMLIDCPNLKKYHQSGNEEHFNVFRVDVSSAELK